jgi:hypothetical protein
MNIAGYLLREIIFHTAIGIILSHYFVYCCMSIAYPSILSLRGEKIRVEWT